MNVECGHIKDDKLYTKSLQGKKIYKDQCVRCFHQPVTVGLQQKDEHGLFVCMKCFNGFCPSHRDEHTKDHNHSLFTNIVMTLKNNEQKVEITKLAIGKQGGAVGGEQYDTAYSVYCNQCHATIQDGMKALEPQVQSLINTDSPFKKQSVASWEVQILPCEHSLTLDQNPVNKDLSKCSDCQLSTNLWLCLTCGNTGCGRKYFDGTGGNNHAIDHFQKTGHPLVVKLGTITAQGEASLYCYACNNDVKDEFLKAHMQTLGIDFGSQKKTEKTIAQMNLDINLNFTLSKQLQNQQNDKPMFGSDYTGMNNIGNSCYLNSVVQMLNSFPQVRDQYYNGGMEHTLQCKLIPSQCFYCQVAKIFIGLNSGQYSQKITRTRVINEKQVTQTFQKAISPFDFKLLIAENNSEFRSARQQDAQEYLQFFLDRLTKEEPKYAKTITSSLFDYKLINRLVCQSCQNFKLVNQKTNLWKFPVPPPTQKDIDTFNDFVQNLRDQDMKKAKSCEQPEYDVKLEDCLNFLRAGDSVSVKCEKCGKNTEFISQNYFKTTPKYLLAMANRFILEKWVPKKLNAILDMPQKLNLSEFLFRNAKNVPGEQMKAQKKKQYSEDNLAVLEGMGYSRNASIRALKATKDNIQAAINWIMDNFDNNIDAPLEEEKQANTSIPQVDENSIMQIQEMGFDDLQARIALIQNVNLFQFQKGSVPESIEWLFNFGGDVTQFMDCLQPQQVQDKQEQAGQGDDNPNYTLKAVIVHLGKSVHSGHYVVYIRKNGAWTLFNDEKVIIPEKALLGKGYLYVYQKA